MLVHGDIALAGLAGARVQAVCPNSLNTVCCTNATGMGTYR